MTRDEFFSSFEVRAYLKETNDGLAGLSPKERGEQLDQLRADLWAHAERLQQAGEVEDLPRKTIDHFHSSSSVTQEVVDEPKGEFTVDPTKNNQSITLFTGLAATGIAAMSAPIMIGFLNVSAQLPFFIAVVYASIWLMTNKGIRWDDRMLNFLHKSIRLIQIVAVALLISLLGIRFVILGGIDTFTLYYSIFYSAFSLFFIMIWRRFYTAKQKEQNQVSDL